MSWKLSAPCWLLAIVCLQSFLGTSKADVSTLSYLNQADKSKLQNIFISSLTSKDLSSVHYAVLGLTLLQTPIPKEQDVCKFLVESSRTATTADNLFFVSNGWKSLPQCKSSPLPSTEIVKKLNDIISLDSASLSEVYYASQALSIFSQKIPDPAKIAKNMKSILKKDDSLINLGYAFHIATVLGPEGSFMLERIEDVIVQADEIDGKYLQFEGGLSTTALVISGVYQLSQTLNKSPTLTGDQAVKFANYFVSRRSVTTCKGAYYLINVAKIFSNNKYHIPVAITLHGGTAVSLEQPNVKVSVTDILGNPLSNSVAVTVESATQVSNGVVVASKLKLSPVLNTRGIYFVNFLEKKPEPGSYRFSVSVIPTPADAKLVGNVGAALTVKVMCWVTISDVSIGTADTDRTTKPKLVPAIYPNKLSQKLFVDYQQRVVLQFALKDKQTSKPASVHQAFVKFTNLNTKQEVILLAEYVADSESYRFDVDLGAKAAAFGHVSGVYGLSLIIGDAVVSNSLAWDILDIEVKFSGEAPVKPVSSKSLYYKPKPEIQHLFREPESRPPVVVSNLFTGLVLLPILILFILWGKLGVNISNFPFSLSALIFHLSLGGVFALFAYFWFELNMFETLKYLSALLVINFWSGNSLLSYIATSKKH